MPGGASLPLPFADTAHGYSSAPHGGALPLVFSKAPVLAVSIAITGMAASGVAETPSWTLEVG